MWVGLSSTTRIRFFFNDTATTEIYTLSLHDALPICLVRSKDCCNWLVSFLLQRGIGTNLIRSEEHTSELQSPGDIVCRLLLDKNADRTELEDAVLDALQQPRVEAPLEDT